MLKTLRAILVVTVACAAFEAALGEERFPPPEFTQGHTLPPTAQPAPRAGGWAYVDMAALTVALSLAAWLALRKRSRRGVFLLMIGSLLYFGFWRRGCVCPIGATQDFTLAIFDTAYVMPLVVLVFFLLPLAFAAVFGRVYCSSVCPLGAAQDLVLFRPLKVPEWLEHALGLLPYVYLGTAVLMAAAGGAFIICQYDPFVAFFRLSGSANMLVFGAAFLVISMFVGRAYCRFLCPYSVLLNLFARLSRWRVTITPDECIQCRLCEDACPFGAIRKPTAGQIVRRTEGKARLAALVVLLPVLVAGVGWLGHLAGTGLALTNSTIRTADLVWQDEHGDGQAEPVNEVIAFRKTGCPSEVLYANASVLRKEYERGGWLVGGWVGLVVGLKLVSLSIRRRRVDYEADRAACVACARCYSSCPREQVRLQGSAAENGAAKSVTMETQS